MAIVLDVLAIVLIAAGLCGAVVPIVPGIPLLFAGLWLAAAAGGYRHVGAGLLVSIAAVGAVGLALDLAAGALGAARVGASRQAVWGALLGTCVGLFLGLPGIVLGPFIGAVAGQLTADPSMRRATEVGLAAWLGLLFGTVIKLVTSLSMLGLFGLGWWWHHGT